VDLVSRAFRNRLKRELPRWREEGLLDADAEATLFRRYDLDEDGVSVAAATIYTLGALLVGAGIVSFVAWNWEDMGRPAKLSVLSVTLVGAHAAGFWMWRIAGVLPRLGHALTMLGTLIFGASIGLIAQMYHIDPDPGASWGIWAIGATVAAWALRSVPNASIAVVVACIWGVTDMVLQQRLLAVVPFAASVPFLALLCLERSSWLFILAAAGFTILTVTATILGFMDGAGFSISMLACSGACVAFSLAPWFARESRVLGILLFSFVAYVCSFHEAAGEIGIRGAEVRRYGWIAVIAPLVVGAGALVVLYRHRVRERPVTLATLAGVLVVFAGLVAGGEVVAATAANLALAIVSFVAIGTAAKTLHRAPFWFGSLLAGLVILSRFLEFETELWLKAIVFLACGVAVIAFGVGFERRLHHAG